MAQTDTNWSHWEGWYSASSLFDALNRTTNAIRFIGPGLPLGHLMGGTDGTSHFTHNWSYNPVTAAFNTGLAGLSWTSSGGGGFSDGIDLWLVRGTTDTSVSKYDISADSWAATGAITAQRRLGDYSDGYVGFGIWAHGGDPTTSQTDTYKLTYSTGLWSIETDDVGFDRKETTGFGDGTTHWMVGSIQDRDSVRKYNTGSQVWSFGTDLPGNRSAAEGCMTQYGTRGYSMKGNSASALLDNGVYVTLAADAWALTSSSSDIAQYVQVYVYDEKIYVAGGDSSGAKTTHQRYDPSTDAWTAETVLTSPKFQARGGANDEHLQQHTIGDTQHTIEGLTEKTTYYVALWSHDKFGNVVSI